MFRYILLMTLLCQAISVQAQQDIRNYITENAGQVTSIHPDSVDFNDLESIGKAIGNARVVMLGEGDHGDAATFTAKTRLIRYLHEKKGFNVLAMESDFFGLNRGWDQVHKTPEAVITFLKKNVTSVWSFCDGCQDLFKKLVPQSFATGNPIQMTGFDNQLALNYSSKNLTHQLDSVMRALQLPVTQQSDYAKGLLPVIDSLTWFLIVTKPAIFYDNASSLLSKVKGEIAAVAGDSSFWTMVVENLVHLANELKYLPTDESKYRNERDQQMARNLAWICKVKYPSEKIIVWAQNFHLSKNSGHYPARAFNKFISMGTAFTNDTVLGKQTYIIGFTSAEGLSGRVGMKPYEVEIPPKKSFEKWIPDNYSYAFVDFKKFNDLQTGSLPEFNMNGSVFYIHKKQSLKWTRIFDGVFYIKTMYPCRMAK